MQYAKYLVLASAQMDAEEIHESRQVKSKRVSRRVPLREKRLRPIKHICRLRFAEPDWSRT